jgi:hypothetical protein
LDGSFSDIFAIDLACAGPAVATAGDGGEQIPAPGISVNEYSWTNIRVRISVYGYSSTDILTARRAKTPPKAAIKPSVSVGYAEPVGARARALTAAQAAPEMHLIR